MLPADQRLFNPKGGDRIAVVSVEPAFGSPGLFMLQLARGAKSGFLPKGGSYGPYTEEDLAAPHAELVAGLVAEGFLPGGAHGAMERLFSDSSAKRGRAAERLGWGGHPDAVDALLAALPKAVDDSCSIIDALGRLGDKRAIPAIRPYAVRKLLSRRRSAVEAMRNLGDGEGLIPVRDRTYAELPAAVAQALLPVDALEPTPDHVAQIVAAAKAAEGQRHGQIADLLYERATPAAVQASAALIRDMSFDRAFVWRYVKSVLKRSMLRGDFRTFGWLMHEIEIRGRATAGKKQTVKSGYDGVERATRIFGRKTQNYVRRAAWRYLRRLAQHRPDAYAPAAAEALLHYTADDAQPPYRKYGALAGCYLLHRILWGASKRFEFVGRSMKFRVVGSKQVAAVPGEREEPYAALWDAQPLTFVRLLTAAKLVDVQEFAFRGISRGHLDVLSTLPTETIIGMLDAPFEPTVNLATIEITRRFNLTSPDWALVDRLCSHERPAVRELGHKFLRDHVASWAKDVDRVVSLLTSADAETRALVADLVILWLATDNSINRPLAERLAALLVQPEATPGLLESVARVCREALLGALSTFISNDVLQAWISHGSASAQSVAGDLLGRRPEAAGVLGIERLAALAQHPVAAIRAGAQALIRSARALWTDDPSLLLALIESDWDDTRSMALSLVVESLDFSRLGVDALLGMLDSNRQDVQNTGIELARRHFHELGPGKLADRLIEHPHVNMRLFALELITGHLPDGAEPLARVERFCRTVLLDVWPQRRAKDGVIDFLLARGLEDEPQARIAARILNEALRLSARCDFERALEALARLKLAYPQIETAVRLASMEVGASA
jgi:hypothetical protein